MNALASYLMMPFIAVFGLEVWVIRLPQLIVSCLTLVAVFGIVRRLAGGRAALSPCCSLPSARGTSTSHAGAESNLAPGFLTFGLYFFVRGLETPRFLPLAALMYGTVALRLRCALAHTSNPAPAHARLRILLPEAPAFPVARGLGGHTLPSPRRSCSFCSSTTGLFPSLPSGLSPCRSSS